MLVATTIRVPARATATSRAEARSCSISAPYMVRVSTAMRMIWGSESSATVKGIGGAELAGATMMASGSTARQITERTIKLHRAGSGSTVLFLHGAGGVPQWLPFFDALAERYELLVPEHPGFGGSDDPPWITSMSDLAMFYLDLVEEAGLDLIHLIGNSLGGWLAAEILVRDRSRFRSLVQLAPAGIRVKGVPCGDNWQSRHGRQETKRGDRAVAQKDVSKRRFT